MKEETLELISKKIREVMFEMIYEYKDEVTWTRARNKILPLILPLLEGYEYKLVIDMSNNPPSVTDADNLAVNLYIKGIPTGFIAWEMETSKGKESILIFCNGEVVDKKMLKYPDENILVINSQIINDLRIKMTKNGIEEAMSREEAIQEAKNICKQCFSDWIDQNFEKFLDLNGNLLVRAMYER